MWTETELNTIVAALHYAIAPATGRTWETGVTENGDAQFYLLGPRPEQACELCVSRIGGRYILEDGSGRLLFEHRNLDLVVLHAKAALSSCVAARGAGNHGVVCASKYNSGKVRAGAGGG